MVCPALKSMSTSSTPAAAASRASWVAASSTSRVGIRWRAITSAAASLAAELNSSSNTMNGGVSKTLTLIAAELLVSDSVGETLSGLPKCGEAHLGELRVQAQGGPRHVFGGERHQGRDRGLVGEEEAILVLE